MIPFYLACGMCSEEVTFGKLVSELDKHKESEVSEPNPGPLHPDGEEEGGQGDDVHQARDGEEERDKSLGGHQPERGVQEEDDPQREVDLDGQPLVPGHALLHQAWEHEILTPVTLISHKTCN